MLNPADQLRTAAVGATSTPGRSLIKSVLLATVAAVSVGTAMHTATTRSPDSPPDSTSTLTFPSSWASPATLSTWADPATAPSVPAATARPTAPTSAIADQSALPGRDTVNLAAPRLRQSQINNAIWYANRQLGRPYQWGGVGNFGFDCSGLVMKAYQFAGVYLPRTTYQQARAGIHITRWQIQPGDLIFSNNFGHVQLYLGGGRIIEAAHPGTQVRNGSLPNANRVNAYVRVRG
jgi:cell wall-associated NlpC family hydrolase